MDGMGVPWGSLIFRQSHMGVSYGDTLKSSKSLDHFSIETYGFRDPPILRHPHMFFFQIWSNTPQDSGSFGCVSFFGHTPNLWPIFTIKIKMNQQIHLLFFCIFFQTKAILGYTYIVLLVSLGDRGCIRI